MTAKFVNRFPQIMAELPSGVSLALKEGAEAIANTAKTRVPVDSGALRDSIHVEFEGSGDWAVVAGSGNVFYGHMVEFGTAFTPARPFLIPATEARKETVAAMVKTALERL